MFFFFIDTLLYEQCCACELPYQNKQEGKGWGGWCVVSDSLYNVVHSKLPRIWQYASKVAEDLTVGFPSQ